MSHRATKITGPDDIERLCDLAPEDRALVEEMVSAYIAQRQAPLIEIGPERSRDARVERQEKGRRAGGGQQHEPKGGLSRPRH